TWVRNEARIRELGYLVAPLEFADLGRTLFFHLIDAHDGMHGNIRALHARELGLQPFFRRIDQQLSALAKDKLFNLDKTIHLALVYRPGEDLVDLALIKENDFVSGFNCHKTL